MDLNDKFNSMARVPGGGCAARAYIVTRKEYAIAMITGVEYDEFPLTRPIVQWLQHFVDLGPGKAPLCAACTNEVPFKKDARTWPQKFVVLYPDGGIAKDIGHGVVAVCSPACPTCAELTDEALVDKMGTFSGNDWARVNK